MCPQVSSPWVPLHGLPPEQRDLASKARIPASHPAHSLHAAQCAACAPAPELQAGPSSGSCAMLTRVAGARRMHVPAGADRSVRRRSGQSQAGLTADVPILVGRRAAVVCREPTMGIVLRMTDNLKESRPKRMTEIMGDALQNAGRLVNPDYLIAVLLLSLSNQHRCHAHESRRQRTAHAAAAIALASMRRPRTPQPATGRHPPASAGARLRHRQRPVCRSASGTPLQRREAPARNPRRNPLAAMHGWLHGNKAPSPTLPTHSAYSADASTTAGVGTVGVPQPHIELCQGGGNSGAAAAALHEVSAVPQPHDSPPGTAEPRLGGMPRRQHS